MLAEEAKNKAEQVKNGGASLTTSSAKAKTVKPHASAGFDSVWQELAVKLPTGTTEADKKRRDKMFRDFDPNGNGYLSLAEIDAALMKVLDCSALFDAKQVTMRAFQSAKGVNDGEKSSVGDDFVDKKEFRLLLTYLRDYFELHVMFTRIDASMDGRVELSEFVAAVPMLKEWGGEVTDAKATFADIDLDGAGSILFDEFCDW